jgi:hypothetical protein
LYRFVADFIGGTHLHLSKLRSSKSRRRALQPNYNFSRKSSLKKQISYKKLMPPKLESPEKFKNPDNFKFVDGAAVTATALHQTRVVEKLKNGSRWVLKSLGINERHYIEATQETFAQEFFRLICPFYPKTRWAAKDGGYYSVLSKEITGFDHLFFLKSENYRLIGNEVKGLAAAQTMRQGKHCEKQCAVEEPAIGVR